MLLALFFLAAAPGGLTDDELARALKGEVPVRTEKFKNKEGKDVGRGLGAIVIDRPIAETWASVSRYEDKAQYIPRLTKVKVLEKRPDALRCFMEVDASLTTVRYTAWYKLDEKAHTVTWELDHSVENGIAETQGQWALFELEPGKTLTVYRVYVDSGRWVPAFVQEHMSVRSIPDLLRAMKKRVESGATWKK